MFEWIRENAGVLNFFAVTIAGILLTTLTLWLKVKFIQPLKDEITSEISHRKAEIGELRGAAKELRHGAEALGEAKDELKEAVQDIGREQGRQAERIATAHIRIDALQTQVQTIDGRQWNGRRREDPQRGGGG